jgi:hypothetical protein
MTNKFKVGDEVRCIDADGWDNCLTEGRVYLVTSLHKEYVRVTDDEGGVNAGFDQARFELVVDERQELSDAMDLLAKHRVRVDSFSGPGGACYYYAGDFPSKGRKKEDALDFLFPTLTPEQLEIEVVEGKLRVLADQLAALKDK